MNFEIILQLSAIFLTAIVGPLVIVCVCIVIKKNKNTNNYCLI